MNDIKLPFWLNADETKALITAAKTWWQRAESWVRWPLGQFDPLTATLGMVNLIAWQRDITRIEDEPEMLYRRRVKFALINAEDAGSKMGFIQIFERLGIGYLEIEERTDPVDWDVILLYVSDSQLGQNQQLLTRVMSKYVRTCRRYQLANIAPITISTPAFSNGASYSYDVASL